MSNLEFYEKTHEYYLNNKRVPSVTQILNPISNEIYRNVEKGVLEHKASIGTITHKCIEEYTLYGLPADFITTNERALDYFDGYLKFREDYKEQFVKTLYAEFQGSYTKDNISFAGTIDNISLFKDGITLIDYKTVEVPNEPLIALQLYGYKLIAEQVLNLPIKHFKALQFKKGGNYELIDLTNLVNDLQTKKLFEYFYEFTQLMKDYGIENQAKLLEERI